jgi:hypothetical protein
MHFRSAQAANRGARGKRNSTDLATIGESVVRVFLRSAQAANRGARGKRNSTDLAAIVESVVRALLKNG